MSPERGMLDELRNRELDRAKMEGAAESHFKLLSTTARHAQSHSAGYGPVPVTQLRNSERSFTAQKQSLTRCAWYENPETIQLWVAEAPAAFPTNSQAICPNEANRASNAATQICGLGRACNSGWVGNENVLGMAANLKS